jgi:membrane protein
VDRLYRFLERNRLTRTPWAVIQTFSKAEGALLAGSMAYYTFLSLLPLLMVAGFVVGSISIANVDVRAALEEAIQRYVPAASGRDVIGQLVGARAAFGLFGFVAVLDSGSGFVGALTACLNRMWEVRAGRNPIGQKLVNLAAVAALGVTLVASVGFTVRAAYVAQAAFGRQDGIEARLGLLASPVVAFVVLLIAYRVLPARRLTFRSQVPGAIFGALGIEALQRAFTFWADHSAGVAVLPRSLLSAVLLLIWLGFLSQVILYGAAVNVVLYRRQRRRRLREWSAAAKRFRTPGSHRSSDAADAQDLRPRRRRRAGGRASRRMDRRRFPRSAPPSAP